VPAIEDDFSDSSDEITADPQAELATDDEWTPPPVSSISKAPASKKPRKSTKDVVQEFDDGRMDDLGLDPFVTPDIEMTAASPVSPVMEAPSTIPKARKKVKVAAQVEEKKPEDLSALSNFEHLPLLTTVTVTYLQPSFS
jgi:hypothetical protein